MTPEQQIAQARIDHVAPLREAVNTEAFDNIATNLNALKAQYINDENLFAHLNGVASCMVRLKEALAKEPSELPPDPVPLSQPEPEQGE